MENEKKDIEKMISQLLDPKKKGLTHQTSKLEENTMIAMVEAHEKKCFQKEIERQSQCGINDETNG